MVPAHIIRYSTAKSHYKTAGSTFGHPHEVVFTVQGSGRKSRQNRRRHSTFIRIAVQIRSSSSTLTVKNEECLLFNSVYSSADQVTNSDKLLSKQPIFDKLKNDKQQIITL